jgi:PAS domain S-box-containing protein
MPANQNSKGAKTPRNHSEEKFARAFRSSPVGLAVTRFSDGMFLEVNQATMSFLGYQLHEMIGKTTIDLGLWPKIEERQSLLDELARNGSVRGLEISFPTKQGNLVVCDYSAEVFELDGETCVLSVLLDITQRRYMEQALKANEELLRLFVKHTPAAIAMFDNEMTYLQVSDRFLTDYQLEGQNIIGKCHYDVFPNLPERWRAAHRRILAGAVERSEEDRYVSADGSEGWLQWESLPWRKANGEIGGLILFTQVITERKRAQEALRASQEQLRALSAKMQSAREEEGTRIAREIHDELGGALTGVKWELERIEHRLSAASGDASITDVQKQISSVTSQIESTIDKVRRISSELRPGVLDDLGLVAAIEWQTQQFQRRTGVKVQWDTEVETANVSHDRATAVFRIFQEVLTNVLRHSSAQNLYVTLRQLDNQLQLKVMDDGRGITDDETRNTTSLGLLGMKERALLVGGEVNITGTPGKGTTVVVTIPTDIDPESENSA